MGKIWIRYLLNTNEIVRIIEKSGWQLVDSIFDKTEDEIKRETGLGDLSFYKFRKEDCAIPLPGPWIGRLCYEVMSPQNIIDEFDRLYALGPPTGETGYLTNYLDDKNIWI